MQLEVTSPDGNMFLTVTIAGVPRSWNLGQQDKVFYDLRCIFDSDAVTKAASRTDRSQRVTDGLPWLILRAIVPNKTGARLSRDLILRFHKNWRIEDHEHTKSVAEHIADLPYQARIYTRRQMRHDTGTHAES